MQQIEIVAPLGNSLASDWERFQSQIDKACAVRLQGVTTSEGLYDLVRQGAVQFWASPKAWAISHVMTHELANTMNVVLAGGDGIELMDEIIPTIEKFARTAHCKFIHMDLRRGFIAREDHTKRGYKELTVCVAKELSDG